MIGNPMRTLEPLIAMAVVLAGCTSTAGWETGAVRYDDRILRAVPPAEVAVYYKRSFDLTEPESDKLGLACDSTTLLPARASSRAAPRCRTARTSS